MIVREEGLKLMSTRCVLFVEDDEQNRDQLGRYLASRVGRLLLASNGDEAFDLFFEHQPDLVITDIQMPGLSGLELADRIKTVSRHTPVIVTTAYSDSDFLQKAIAVGVDGYVLKPTDLAQLVTVCGRCLRVLANFEELQRSRAILLEYHQNSEMERHMVARLMEKMMRHDKLRDPLVQYWISPADVVAGDLIGATRSPHGKLYFMLTDSSGRGLVSTLNLLPINHVFYDMVSRNQPVSLIVEAMNREIQGISPPDRHFACVVGAIDPVNRILEIWNGGLPEVLFVEPEGATAHRFPSMHPALGLLDSDFNPMPQVVQYQRPGQICVYSDGLFGACQNPEFTDDPMTTFLEVLSTVAEDQRLHEIKCRFTERIVGSCIQDDISILLVKTNEVSH